VVTQRAFTIWFTGISKSGKSSISAGVTDALRKRQLHVELLDSGRIRRELNRSLGFTREEITMSMIRLAYECRMLNRNGVVAVVGAVSPYRDARDHCRKEIGEFVEVYCRCPIDVLKQRDDMGLFERAERGEIQHVAGINAPYEEPIDPDVIIDTDQCSVDEAVNKVITTLEELGYVEKIEPASYTPEEEEMIRKRLTDLGYL
jgi:adenylylsulfate kinase